MGIDRPNETPSPTPSPDHPDVSAASEPGPDRTARWEPEGATDVVADPAPAPDHDTGDGGQQERLHNQLEPEMPDLPSGESDNFNYQPIGLVKSYEDRVGTELEQAEGLGRGAASAERQPEEFRDALNGAADAGGLVKWTVSPDGDLRVMNPDPGDLKHTVLTEGGDVIAAGEAAVSYDDDGNLQVDLEEHSGHYRPDEADGRLALGASAFELHGIRVITRPDTSSGA